MTLRLHKAGQSIDSLESWFMLAPPKEGSKQWVVFRSAKEFARSFVGSGIACVPLELRELLRSNPVLGVVDIIEATPEEKVPLDEFRGETRNADLVAIGKSSLGAIAISVEAKADETFGETIAARLSKTVNPRSNLPKRIRRLTLALFGTTPEQIGELRYQLLHGVAASLILASQQKAIAAVFVVFEFRSSICTEENFKRNSRDLDAFVCRLGGAPIKPSVLQDPFNVPGNHLIPSDIPLYIGREISYR